MSLPAGYSPPAYANIPEDRAGWAVVASGVGLVFILLFASIRLYTRYPFRFRLLYDDLAIIVSTVLAIIQSCLVIGAASQGLGKAASIVQPGVQVPTEKMLYASDLFYLFSTFSSRTAVLCLLYALSPEHWHKLASKLSILLSMLMAIAAIFMIGFGCRASSPWEQVSHECNAIYARWTVIIALGILLEFLMILITLRMLFMLQKHWTGKLKAIVVFALRLPIIPIAIYRLLALHSLRSTANPFLARTTLTAWTQGEMVYSLTTAVIPTLMPFLVKLNTGLGAFSRDDFIQQTTHQESSFSGGGNSFAMQSFKNTQSGSRMRPDHVQFQSMVVSQKEPSRRRSVSSDDSQKVMVRKSVDVTYSNDDRR